MGTTNSPVRSALAVLLLIALLPAGPVPVRGDEAAQAVTVGTGSIGESATTSMLQHQVQGRSRKRVGLSTVASSLCGDTGVVAMLVVNGTPKVHGVLTRPESRIEVLAKPGDRVIAVAHAIPLYNGIHCVRLGELKLALWERDAQD